MLNARHIILLFICFLTTSLKAAEKEYKLNSENYILILSANQYENPYTTAIAKKIQNELEQANPALIFRTVYASLDIQKTMLASRLNMQKAFSQARLTRKVLVPRVLVLIGDESWMLYRIMNLRGIWGKVPVVLCSVHPKILKDYGDFFTADTFTDSLFLPVAASTKKLSVTGVLRDEVSYNRTQCLSHSFPSLKEIVYISNGTYDDEYSWYQEKKMLGSTLSQVKTSYFNCRKTDRNSICNYINRLPADSAAVVFNSIPSFIADLQIPSYSLRDGGPTNNQITGGYFTTSDQYARQTASLIMRIYEGTPLTDLPFQYVQQHYFYRNAQSSYSPPVPRDFLKAPELRHYNLPPPFFMRHLRPITLLLVLACIFIISYLIYARTRKYQQESKSLLTKYKLLHEKFRIIYDNMPIALLIFDSNGSLLHKNDAALALLRSWKWKHPEAPNLYDDFFPDRHLQDKIRHQENINRMLSIYEGRYLSRPTGIQQEVCQYFRLVIRYIPGHTPNENNILVMLVDTTDIYQEKIAHKKMRNVLHFAMNKADIGVAQYNLFDQAGMVSDSWRHHMGWEGPESWNDRTAYRYVAPDDRQILRQFLQQAREGKEERLTCEISVCPPNDTVHYIRENIKVMEYHPEQGQIRVAEINENIDREKQLASAIQAATRKAREAEQLKNTFIANMSHEIRTPLNAIVGFSNLMIVTGDLEIRQEMIHHIEENNEILLRLVNDIIDLSKIESGSMTFAYSVTDVNALLQDVATIYQIKANQKKLQFSCECPQKELYILTDKIRLKQLMTNFLTNALKFTKQGSIRLGYRLDQDRLTLYVSDTGIGIPETQRQSIFKRFYRANKTAQGYGLGLSISQAIVEGLNGEISVESEEGRGSTFRAIFPVKKAKPVTSPSAGNFPTFSDDREPHHQPHILIVEDDPSNFLLLHFMLKNHFRISHAWNGEEAIDLFGKGNFDLILMDLKIPGKNGYETTLEIRAQSRTIPIIATTAYAFSKDETQALDNGFNAFLAKPLDKKTLLETINHWLNHVK